MFAEKIESQPRAGQPSYRGRSHPRVAAIVPAYNEAGRIGRVLAVLSKVERISEIIVVDDGSGDATEAEAARFAREDRRFRVLRHSRNLGKGQALYTAFAATAAPVLLMLDADLMNLNSEHISGLIVPVLSRQADMTLGLFKHGYWRTDMAHRLTPWLSGQRCFRAEILQDLSESAAAGYGFETALSLAARQQGWRCQEVPLVGVTHPPGDIPRGGWRGPATKIRMFAHIGRAWFLALGLQDWKPRVMRRARLMVLLFFALDINLTQSVYAASSGLVHFILIKCLNSEVFWLLWRGVGGMG